MSDRYPDVECPYCGDSFDLDHDDGAYYTQDRGEEAECESCGKHFIVYSSCSWSHEGSKADCLNGADHDWSQWQKLWAGEEGHEGQKFERRYCKDCDKSEEEWHDE